MAQPKACAAARCPRASRASSAAEKPGGKITLGQRREGFPAHRAHVTGGRLKAAKSQIGERQPAALEVHVFDCHVDRPHPSARQT